MAIRLAVTGGEGFIGSHLRLLAAADGHFELLPLCRADWESPAKLRAALAGSDAVVHLAGLSRHADGDFLYRTNVALTQTLIACAPAGTRIYLGSTTHEKKDLPYHRSKRESRRLLEERGNCGILLMANTFGPGSRPFYNSVVSTFCKLAAEKRTPERIDEVMLPLISVWDLCGEILTAVKAGRTGEITIAETFSVSLPELWAKLQAFHKEKTPELRSRHDAELYVTAMSYGKD